MNNMAVNKPVPAEKLVLARWMVGLALSTYLLCFWFILKSILTRWNSALGALLLGCGNVLRIWGGLQVKASHAPCLSSA